MELRLFGFWLHCFFSEIAFLYTIKITNSHRKNIIIIVINLLVVAVSSCIYNVYNDGLLIEIKYLYISFFRGLLAYIFIICGYEFRRVYKKIIFKKVFFVLGLIGYLTIQTYTDNHVNMHTFNFNDVIVFFFTGLLGSLAVITFCNNIMRKVKWNFISDAGVKSFDLMIVHYSPFPYIKISAYLSNKLAGEAIVFFMFFVVLFFSYLTTYILKEIRNFFRNKNIEIYL